MHTTKQLFDLTGRTALITGGSRGLGLQMAEALGEQGAKLIISSRKQNELDEAVAHLKKMGIDVLAIAADLGKEESIKPLSEAAMKHLGHVDILIMDLNVRSIFLLSQSIGKLSMIPRKYGRIVNIASIAGLAGNGANMQTLAYNTSKAAVINFTRTLAGEWGKYGITVNGIAPGFFPSKMSRGLLETMGEDAIQRAPLRRLGDDEDFKGAVVLFSSAAGKHITGQTLAIDGGVSAVII